MTTGLFQSESVYDKSIHFITEHGYIQEAFRDQTTQMNSFLL